MGEEVTNIKGALEGLGQVDLTSTFSETQKKSSTDMPGSWGDVDC